MICSYYSPQNFDPSCHPKFVSIPCLRLSTWMWNKEEWERQENKKLTEKDGDRQKQTETGRDRQRQTETDSDTQRQSETERGAREGEKKWGKETGREGKKDKTIIKEKRILLKMRKKSKMRDK